MEKKNDAKSKVNGFSHFAVWALFWPFDQGERDGDDKKDKGNSNAGPSTALLARFASSFAQDDR
jgi:hypothetical protein